MPITRRSMLKGFLAAVAGAVSGAPAATASLGRAMDPGEMEGILYDPTRCTGCKGCVRRCGEIHDRVSLTAVGDGVRRQCMQCLEPSCVPACPTRALRKGDHGIVSRDRGRCVECGSCAAACTFRVAATRRCDLCAGRLSGGKIPGCCEACPSGALLFGKRPGLIAEAKSRQEKDPGRYHPGVYGKREAGGTRLLLLSRAGVPFGEAGLPAAEDIRSHADHLRAGTGFPGRLAWPVALGGVLAAMCRDAPEDSVPGAGAPRKVPGRRKTDAGHVVIVIPGNPRDPGRDLHVRRKSEEEVAR